MGPVAGARERLDAVRAEAAARLVSLARDYDAVVVASRDSNADDEHDPEGATIAFERSQIGAILRQVREQLAEIDAALERLDSGAYGICETCRTPISAGRLEARPTARVCVRCASCGNDSISR
jgi:DnaK suppressor protein